MTKNQLNKEIEFIMTQLANEIIASLTSETQTECLPQDLDQKVFDAKKAILNLINS